MKYLICIIFVLCFYKHGIAQAWQVNLSGDYLNVTQWDRAIKTYNFSRPFVNQKQPLIKFGIKASLNYFFRPTKHFNQGLQLTYGFYQSSVGPDPIQSTLNLHFINFGYIIHFNYAAILKGLYTDLTVSASSCTLFKRINFEPFEYDNARSKAYGIGGNIDVKLGYSLRLNNKYSIAPFLGIGYTPYLYAPNVEAVINQTKGLLNTSRVQVLNTQVGLAFFFIR